MAIVETTLAKATALHRAGKLRDAEATCQRLLLEVPHQPDVHRLLGRLAQQQGRLHEAVAHFQKGLVSAPDDFVAQFHLAEALAADRKCEAAVEAYRRALQIRPADLAAWNNLGSLLLELGNHAEAIGCFGRAIALDSRCHRSHYNLGCAHRQAKAFDAAAACFARAVELHPQWPEALNQQGSCLARAGHPSEAAVHYQKAIQIGGSHLLWNLRLDALAPPIFSDASHIDQYRDAIAEKLNQYQRHRAPFDIRDIDTAPWKPPMRLAYQGRDDRSIKSRYASLFEGRVPAFSPRKLTGKPHVGFLVTPGHEGVFGRSMAGVLNRLAGQQLDVTLICSERGHRQLGATITSAAVRHVPLVSNVSQAAKTIYDVGVDLLYYWEIGTDPLNYFLPMFRPATVQCTSWGWPVTSGIPGVDYFISCEALEPPGAEAHYTERLVRLAHLPNYYPRPARAVVAADRSRLGLPDDARVYLCAQNPSKIHPDFDLLVAEILRRDARGRFVMIEASQDFVTEGLLRRFRNTLGDVADRVKFCPRMSADDYRSLLATADVILDTVHYSGGANTTYDAFAAGTPVVTWPGEFHRGRYAFACYQMMDLPECVATSFEEYVNTAIRIARDRAYRNEIAERIRQRCGMFFENTAAVQELQDFFIQAIEMGRCGESTSAEAAKELERDRHEP